MNRDMLQHERLVRYILGKSLAAPESVRCARGKRQKNVRQIVTGRKSKKSLRYKYHNTTTKAPSNAEMSTALEDKMATGPEPLLEPLPLPLPLFDVLVGVTDATEPIVAEGTGPSAPFMASDSEESCAKPTEAGLERKTE